MRTFLRITAAFTAAVLFASLLGSVFSTQFVIGELQSVGADVDFATRLSMTVKDFAILQTLGLAIGASFLVGFVVAALCVRFIGGNRTAWYVFAGASAVISLLFLMSWQLQLMPIAGARSNLGMAFQGLAGALGGWLFAILSQTTTHSQLAES